MMENEQISTTTHWADPDSFLLLLDKARQFAGEYIDGLVQRPVFPAERSLQAMDALDEPLPEEPSDPLMVLARLHEIGSPSAVAQTSGRYFGFVNGGMIPVALAAKWLADAWDQNTAHYVMSLTRVSKKSANDGSWLFFAFPWEPPPALCAGRRLRISPGCALDGMNCFVGAAGTLLKEASTVHPGSG
jgi:hypothetical protein